MTTEDLIKSVDLKLSLLLKDKEELRKIILGNEGKGGLVEDLHEIRMVLQGDPKYKREGLVEIVQRHDELFKKMQNMSSFAIAMISLGAGAASFGAFIIHRWDKIKEIF